jgi:hypothetical protein
MELDRQRALLLASEPPRANPTVIIQARFNGVWLPLELDRASLLAAVGLPQHEIFREGIFHSFQPELPTHGAQADVDHDDEDMEF